MQCDAEYYMGHRIGSLSQSFRIFFANSLKQYNLSFEQGVLLFVISENPNKNLSDIAKKLDKNKATISREINLLVAKGLVYSKRIDSDKRVQIFSLTENGQNTLYIVKESIQKFEVFLREKIPAKDMEIFLNVLSHLKLIVEDCIKNSPLS